MKIGSLSKFMHNDDFRSAKPADRVRPRPDKVAAAGAVAGATVGAVVGAGIGYAQGLETLRNPEATVTNETYFSTQPRLVGARYDDEDSNYVYDSFSEEWRWETDDDDWDPIIERVRNKQYSKPVFRTEQAGLLRSVATGALKGAAIGGVVGAVGAVGARAAGWNGLNGGEILENPGVAAAIGGATGAVIGGVAGFQAGKIAQQNALVETRTAPTYERQHIGWQPTERAARQISRDFNKGSGDFELRYSEVGDRYGTPAFQGHDKVYSRVQVGEHSEDYLSSSITPLKGALLGVAGGAALGVAVGVGASVFNRLMEA
jgi:hypothetical protein